MESNQCRNVFIPPPSSYHDVDFSQFPRLHRAVWKGQLQKLMKYLSEEKNYGKIDKTDFRGRTALHLAASCGYSNYVNVLLIMRTRDVDMVDENGHTAFFKAVQCLSLECMRELYDHGAKVDLCDNNFITPAEYLIMEHDDRGLHCLEFIIKEIGVHQRDKNGSTLLHLAASHGRIDITKLLMKYKADLDATDDEGRTPLIIAAQNNQHSIVEVLVAEGANIFLNDKKNRTALDLTKESPRTHNLLKSCVKSQLRNGDTIKSTVDVQCGGVDGKRDGDQIRSSPDNEVTKMKKLIHQMEDEHESHVTALEFQQKKHEKLIHEGKSCRVRVTSLKKRKANRIMTSQSSQASSSQGSLRNSVKSFFKRKFESKEEWAVCYDELVDRYDELHRGYGKLLMTETEKEVELEEKLEELAMKECELSRHQYEVRNLQNELQKSKQNTQAFLSKKATLKEEINILRKSIPKEKSKCKELARSNEQQRKKKNFEFENLKRTKEGKIKEIENLEDEEKMLRQTVESQNVELNDANEARLTLIIKCNQLKGKYQTLLDVD